MPIEFKVTDHGLQVDGRGILPGSTLALKSTPPSHWSRFGGVEVTAEKKLVVATPPKDQDAVTTEKQDAPKRRGRPRRAAE